MKKLEVVAYLMQIKEARETFAKVQTKFASDVDAMMNRLIHEGARNYMSAEEIARAAGMPVKRIRAFMRSNGLAPSDSKTLLSKKAAEALSNNAALLGIEPSEMDLMSPLAYLPMGEKMKRQLQDSAVSQVFPETYGDAHVLAEKLTDSGLDFEDAVEWVNEVIARGEQIQ
jgi:hypothetical protein